MIGRKWWVPWLWLSPALLLSGVFLLYPTLDTIRRSFLSEGSDGTSPSISSASASLLEPTSITIDS